MLETLIKELGETWDYTTEELNDIREKMREFGAACVMDSVIRKEDLDL